MVNTWGKLIIMINFALNIRFIRALEALSLVVTLESVIKWGKTDLHDKNLCLHNIFIVFVHNKISHGITSKCYLWNHCGESNLLKKSNQYIVIDIPSFIFCTKCCRNAALNMLQAVQYKLQVITKEKNHHLSFCFFYEWNIELSYQIIIVMFLISSAS